MNINLIQCAFNQNTKRSSEKLTLVAMAYHSYRENLACPTLSQLCRNTGLSTATVSAAIKALLIECYIIDTGDKSGKSRIYRFPDEAA